YRRTRSQTCLPLLDKFLTVVRMNRFHPPPALRLFRGHGRVIEPYLVEEVAVAIGASGPRCSGDGIDDGGKIALARMQSLFRPCVGDSDRGLIRKQTQPSELLLTVRLAAENSDNPQQFVPKDEGMPCKTANLLTFRPFRSHNPIVLRGDVFDEN